MGSTSCSPQGQVAFHSPLSTPPSLPEESGVSITTAVEARVTGPTTAAWALGSMRPHPHPFRCEHRWLSLASPCAVQSLLCWVLDVQLVVNRKVETNRRTHSAMMLTSLLPKVMVLIILSGITWAAVHCFKRLLLFMWIIHIIPIPSFPLHFKGNMLIAHLKVIQCHKSTSHMERGDENVR